MSGRGRIDVREKAMVVLFGVRSVSFGFDSSRRGWILRRIVGLGQEAYFRDAGLARNRQLRKVGAGGTAIQTLEAMGSKT
jgi:hypothetical protein